MLKDIVLLNKGVVLLTGDSKKLGKIFMNSWLSKGLTFLAEALPFDVNYPEQVFVGEVNETFSFDGYLIVNLLSRPKAERARLYNWIRENKDRLILIYEEKYVKDSITRYGVRELIDYLVAYKRETLGFERVDVYKFENGRVVKRKSYARRI